jgi:NADPH-dependent ferric siderophore reductase
MHASVISVESLTPSLVRVVLAGEELDRFEMPDHTDSYVNVAIPPADATYGDVFDPADIKRDHPDDLWPRRRRYTVRHWDPVEKLLTLDFVVHGSAGAGGAWAAGARPGTVLVFEGPSGGYQPDATADWHLLVGDESALPAIAASLERLPAGSRAVVRLVCDGPDYEIPLSCAGDLDLAWSHRSGEPADGDLLAAAVRDAQFPSGRVHAFVHGEAEEIREIRRHLLGERGLTRQQMSCSPYWRRTMTDEAWRRVKRDFVSAMESDVA